MKQLLEAFLLGNTAIISNVCVLPLYPGLLAFLASQEGSVGKRSTGWLGVLVLAGVLSLMLVVGVILFLVRKTVSSIVPWFLPLAYALVLILGIMLIVGKNPFARLTSGNMPTLGNRYATAYVYGLLLGPLTLPCTGPLIISALVLGTGDAVALFDGIMYFLAFGLGFGWPLVALSLMTASVGRSFALWIARRSHVIHRVAGVILIGIALFGLWTDVLSNV
ncbi:MAG: hypothetical protein KAX40_02850 [Herpetosiphon sp.]|nr:hypothetical protein [Herpetosiphon sp.]